jgi:hypothetical protein
MKADIACFFLKQRDAPLQLALVDRIVVDNLRGLARVPPEPVMKARQIL